MEFAAKQDNSELTTQVLQQLADQDSGALTALLEALHPVEVSKVLESVPGSQRDALLGMMDESQKSQVLPTLHEGVRTQVLTSMDALQLAETVEPLDDRQLIGILENLPVELSETILASLDADNRDRVNATLDYPEGSAGRIMSTDVLSVRPDNTLSAVLRWLQRQNPLPPYTSSLMVTESSGTYLGKLPISVLVSNSPTATVESVMLTESETVRAHSTEQAVADLFDERDLVSVAVLDEDNQLIGRITVDNALKIMRKQADHALLSQAGLKDEADLFAPILPSAKQRGVWLGINLLTVFMAALVISHFQSALDQLVALAVLMPIVASMGGIAGSQTLTLTIRGLALGQIVKGNVRWLASKELGVGALNGIVWATVVAVITFLWFKNAGLSVVIAIALVLNLLAAAASGVAVPLVLKRMGMDPALAGAVVLTTVTDIVGFLSFLGLATAFLL